MVKANIQVNYYSALELPSDATVEDIKKQYRKLALKHHPDRGGAVEKFQAIQAAHEVLEDPATKAKYDADRRKAGLIPTFGRPGATAPRPNPYAAATGTSSAYPPPPRRTATTSGGAAGWRPSATGTTGADRFTNFPRPAPTSKRDSDKSNVFTAWQNMNQKKDAQYAQQQQQQQQPQQPRPQPKGAFGASPQKPRPHAPPRTDTRFPSEDEIRAGMNHRPAPAGGFHSEKARTAWADFNASQAGKPGMARSNTTKTPRKGGFDPMAGGDEGQAGSTHNYSSSRARTKSDDARSYPPPPPRYPDAAPDEQDAPYTEGSRIKTPYSSHIGQQKYMSSDNLRRANPSKQPPPPKTTPPKQTSSNGTKPRPFIVEDSSDDSDSEIESTATTPEHNAQSKPDLSSNPFAPRPKRTPVAPSSRSTTASPFKPPSFESMASSGFGSNKANVGTNDSFATDQSNASNTTQPDQETADKGKNTMYEDPSLESVNPLPNISSLKPLRRSLAKPVVSWAGFGDWAIPSSIKPSSRKDSALPRVGNDHSTVDNSDLISTLGPVSVEEKRTEKNTPPFPCNNVRSVANGTGVTNSFDKGFTFPVDNNIFASSAPNGNARASKSEERINTTFTPEQWAGTFSANNVFAAPTPARKPSSPARKSSRILRSSTSNLQNASTTATTPAPTPFAQYSGSAPGQVPQPPLSPPQQPVKFSADEWAKTMKDSQWNFQPDVLRSDASLSGSSRPSSRGTRKASVKKIPTTIPRPATATAVEEEEAQQAATGDANVTAQPQPQPPAADDMMDIDMDGVSPAPGTPSDFIATPAQKKEPKFVQVDPSSLRKSTRSTETTDEPALKTNLNDLASVLSHPTTANGGLSDLADVASTLPFASKSAPIPPTKNYTPQLLSLPKLPVAPETPAKLTRQSWRRHCELFARYMGKFHDFDSAMLAHFNSRREAAAVVIARGVPELESVGAEGWKNCLRAVEEDERVRVHYNVGHDRHLEACKSFEGVRERVRVLAEGAGLSEV